MCSPWCTLMMYRIAINEAPPLLWCIRYYEFGSSFAAQSCMCTPLLCCSAGQPLGCMCLLCHRFH
jgi:hypothetical protein